MKNTNITNEDKRPKAETLLVSATFKDDDTVSVLVVGKPRRGGLPDIINAFEGLEANELWRKISQVKYDNTKNT